MSVSIVTSNENPLEPLFLYNRTTDHCTIGPQSQQAVIAQRERERRLWDLGRPSFSLTRIEAEFRFWLLAAVPCTLSLRTKGPKRHKVLHALAVIAPCVACCVLRGARTVCCLWRAAPQGCAVDAALAKRGKQREEALRATSTKLGASTRCALDVYRLPEGLRLLAER